MKRKESVAVTAAIQLLIKLGEQHGVETTHYIYREAIAELMGNRERDNWRDRIKETQSETFGLLTADD